eukprot:862037-Rhodomonas_salina.1
MQQQGRSNAEVHAMMSAHRGGEELSLTLQGSNGYRYSCSLLLRPLSSSVSPPARTTLAPTLSLPSLLSLPPSLPPSCSFSSSSFRPSFSSFQPPSPPITPHSLAFITRDLARDLTSTYPPAGLSLSSLFLLSPPPPLQLPSLRRCPGSLLLLPLPPLLLLPLSPLIPPLPPLTPGRRQPG